jgi:hypothetical protein
MGVGHFNPHLDILIWAWKGAHTMEPWESVLVFMSLFRATNVSCTDST